MTVKLSDAIAARKSPPRRTFSFEREERETIAVRKRYSVQAYDEAEARQLVELHLAITSEVLSRETVAEGVPIGGLNLTNRKD